LSALTRSRDRASIRVRRLDTPAWEPGAGGERDAVTGAQPFFAPTEMECVESKRRLWPSVAMKKFDACLEVKLSADRRRELDALAEEAGGVIRGAGPRGGSQAVAATVRASSTDERGTAGHLKGLMMMNSTVPTLPTVPAAGDLQAFRDLLPLLANPKATQARLDQVDAATTALRKLVDANGKGKAELEAVSEAQAKIAAKLRALAACPEMTSKTPAEIAALLAEEGPDAVKAFWEMKTV
jgi:hypothetical protein